jgi:multidrug resistance efflux pump
MSTTTVRDTDLDQTAVATDDSIGDTPALDAAVAEAAGRRPRLRTALRLIRTTLVVLILLAGAVAGGGYIVQQRVAARAFVDAGTAVLTAEPMLVGSADAGVVKETLVSDRQSVTAGAALARITLTANGTSAQPRVQVLRAPTAGIVSDINVAVGGVARAGEPVITLYDPTQLAFLVEVPLETLRQLRLGMTAYISGPGLKGQVSTTLEEVRAKVDNDPFRTSDRLTVVLKPAGVQLDTVRTLVPGLQFDVVVDTKTAVGRTPAVNSA